MSKLAKLYGNYKNSEKYTPQYAVLPIIKYLPKNRKIWCPFDTENSEFVLTLQEKGFEVIYSHISTGKDFFEYEPCEWDIIVSNPPFKNKKEVFERCLEFGKPFGLLMSNLWLNDSAPCQIFRNYDLQLLLFDKRVQYDKNSRVPFGSSYFCHRLLPKQIIFENLEVVSGQYSRMHSDFA